ncbi:MAG TPA: hypothetical protein VNJ02_00965 [Vicinamibacterales bacterium]|nr:hypothetical protein [Vicinamibacterales bacterium]
MTAGEANPADVPSGQQVVFRNVDKVAHRVLLDDLDGKAFRPDGKAAATLIPPAFGMAGVNQHTWTGGWGNVTYWNAFVANLELNGRGNFLDARLDDAKHVPPMFTEPGWNTYKGSEIGIDDSKRTDRPIAAITAPLRGLMTHAKGGFYHDGRFADLAAVIAHYDQFLKLRLTDAEKRDLTEYLKSL